MIAKINFDGKDRLAIVFDKYLTFDHLQRLNHALNECLLVVSQSNDYLHLISEDLYYIHSLIEQMELSTEQFSDMCSLYYDEKRVKDNKAIQKNCVISI